MKYLLVLLLLLSVDAAAQTLSGGSDVSVLQKKMLVSSKSLRTTRVLVSPQNENSVDQRIRELKDQQRQNAQRIKEGVYPEGPRSALKSPGYYDSKQNVVTSYSYQIKVQNNGNRTIKKIAWEYVFIDRETNKEMGKHKFLSKTNLKPRETDNLIEKHLTPPIYVIDAKNAGKNLSDLFIEQVNITRIEYSDGSIWESDAK